MKNNRQIGLDGRSFISSALRRSPYCVLGLIMFGLFSAASDILKLTGASGAIMGSFTTTLLIYDLIAALMLIVVTFYAFFLECGLNIPKLKDKPLLVFGSVRLCYYILLGYYLCYRALYCIANSEQVPTAVAVYYGASVAATFLAVFGNSFYLNILSRNMIRRSYEKSFARISVFGIIFQSLVPVTYIIARFTMGSYSDEYLTTSVCDVLRLCVSPIFYISLWIIYKNATAQVREVYNEVDDALRSKRYQITYSAEESKKEKRKKDRNQRKKAKQLRKKAAEAQNQALVAALVAGMDESEEKSVQTDDKAQPAAEAKPSEESAAEQEEKSEKAAAASVERKDNGVTAPPLGVSSFTAAQLEQIAKKAVSDAAQNEKTAGGIQQAPAKPPEPVVYAAHGQVEEYDPYRNQTPPSKQGGQKKGNGQSRPQGQQRPQGQPRPQGQQRPQNQPRPQGQKKGGKKNQKKYYPPKNPNGQR